MIVVGISQNYKNNKNKNYMKETKLNMEEKKKLEKIAIDDINKVVNALVRNKSEAINSFQVKPSPEATKLHEAIVKTSKELLKLEESLKKTGFRIQNQSYDYNTGTYKEKALVFDNNNNNKDYADLDKKWSDKIAKAEGMKRTVIISLYTTGQEAQQFLKDLEVKLNDLLK